MAAKAVQRAWFQSHHYNKQDMDLVSQQFLHFDRWQLPRCQTPFIALLIFQKSVALAAANLVLLLHCHLLGFRVTKGLSQLSASTLTSLGSC
jgi:hypothetical protein